jgi:hypothetical protein
VPILAIIVFIYLHRQYKKRLRAEDKVDAEKYKSMDFGMDLSYGTKRAKKNGGPGFDGRQMKGLSMDAAGHPFFLNSSEMAKASTDSLLMEDRYRPVVLASRANSRANSRASSPTRRGRTDTDTTLGSHSTRHNESSQLKYSQSASSPRSPFADEKPLPMPQPAKVKETTKRDSYFEKNAKAIRKSNNYLTAFFTTKEQSWDEKPEPPSESSSHVNSTASTVADSRTSTKTPATSVSVDEPLPEPPLPPQASDPPTQSVEKRVLALPPEPVRCPSFDASIHEYTPSFISETTNLTDILNTPRDSNHVFPPGLSNLPPRGQSLARTRNQSVDAYHQHDDFPAPQMPPPRGQPVIHAREPSHGYHQQQDFEFEERTRSPEMPVGGRNQSMDRYNPNEFEFGAHVQSEVQPAHAHNQSMDQYNRSPEAAHAHDQSVDGYNQRQEFQARVHSPEMSTPRRESNRSHRFHGELLDLHTQNFLAESPERPRYNLHGEIVEDEPEMDHQLAEIPPRGQSLAAAMPAVDEGDDVDGLAVPHADRAQQRLSVLMRPLPAEDPTENPEERANRIRSFYKEYFDDSKPFTSQVALPSQAADYYEDYGSEYQNGATVYDAESNGFVVAAAPYAEPVTRRAMTPPPRAPPRFQPGFQQGPPRGRPRNFSNAGPGLPMSPMPPRKQSAMNNHMMPPRGQSAMSNHMMSPRNQSAMSNHMLSPRNQSAMSSRSRGPPKRPMPPPQPLNSLPTPHQLKNDDAIFSAADFAPPISFRDRQAGRRPDSPLGAQRPYSPTVRAFVPLASSFEDLAAIPSP